MALIFITGLYTGHKAVELHRFPPFFSTPFFLALTMLETTVFAGMVGWAIARRRRTEWHRRLMMGATIILLEPALGRLVPIPLLGGWAQWTVMALQLGIVAIIARDDYRRLGHPHPATLAVALTVVGTHSIIALLSVFPPFIGYAGAVAAG